MPGFQDTAVIALIALLLFGPKKLPVLARQLGKIMADFRRASNEFRTQMEEELRISEQAERQKKVEALQASTPSTALPPATPDPSLTTAPTAETIEAAAPSESPAAESPTPEPIATAGDLSIHPPVSGLPIARAQSEPPAPTHDAEPAPQPEPETTLHG